MKRSNRRSYPKDIINLSRPFTTLYILLLHGISPFIILINAIGYGLSIYGRRHLPEKNAILISNHVFFLDPNLIAGAIFPKRTYFSVMEETFSMPFFGMFIRLLGAFPLPNRNPLPIVFPKVKKAIRRQLVHFFPEGVLYNHNQRIKPFRPGAFYLAYQLHVPVIPMTTVLTYRRIGGKKLTFLPPKVTIVIGKAVHPGQFDDGVRTPRQIARSMAEHMRSIMQETIDRCAGR